MDRFITCLQAVLLIAACSSMELPDGSDMATIILQTGTFTKSASPEESRLSDVNIFVFNRDGLLEQKIYIGSSALSRHEDGFSYDIHLLKNCTYSIYVCANTGFSIPCSNLEELLEYRYYMAYPDDYRIGIPMSGSITGFSISDEREIMIPLSRTMAKISVSIDRSALADNVEFNVKELEVHGCPKSISMFQPNKVELAGDIYTVGFIRNGEDANILNTNVYGQISGEVSLYLLENMQGKPLGDIVSNSDKVFEEDDPLEWKCSYIELTADYISEDYYSSPGQGLIYRFYLGSGAASFDVERNCHYHITVKPEGDGLPECRWRVDKTGLIYCGETYLRVTPDNYIRGKIGDTIHIRCDYKPSFAILDIGLEELEFDHDNGIYDYTLDEDGKGVVLKLTGSGSGMLYIEAGAPINQSELVIIEVDLPENSAAAHDSSP